jgi:hypothetical protein
MPSNSIPEPWHSFLSELDSFVSEAVHLICLGGFVITQQYGLGRPTVDIDTLSIAPHHASTSIIEKGGEGSDLHKKYKIYIHQVGICTYPDSYEDRLTEMFPGNYKNLHLYALDPYDLALAKIERNIERDRDDVKYLAHAIPFDLEVLRTRYLEELRPYLGRPEREDLTLQLWIEAIEDAKR